MLLVCEYNNAYFEIEFQRRKVMCRNIQQLGLIWTGSDC